MPQQQHQHLQLQTQGSHPHLIWPQPLHSWGQAASQQQQMAPQLQQLPTHQMPSSIPVVQHQPSGVPYLQHQASLPQQHWLASTSCTSLPMPQAYAHPQLYMQQNSLQPPMLTTGTSLPFPQQPIQQQHQHQLPHLNTQTSSTGFQNSGLWPQQSIPSQQPDSPIVNTQGNPFAPPRAYLLDEDEEGQPKSDQVAQPASSNPNEISSSSGRSEPASDRFPSNSFRPPQLESSHNAQPVKGEDPWQSLSFQSKSPYLLPSSSSSAALSSWQQFPESAVASSGAAASKSLESGGIPGWHTFDASQAGPSQIQPQQQQPQDLHATCPTSGGPGVLQPPQPWQQHANQHSSRHADKNAAAQSSHGIAHEDCDAASSILGSLSRGQVLSQKAMIPRQSSARY